MLEGGLGVMNRMEQVSLEIAGLLKSSALRYYVFHIDICNFRTINHLYGYSAGDELLSRTAEFIKTLPSCIYSRRGYADQFIFVIETDLPLSEELLYRFHRYSHNFVRSFASLRGLNLFFWCGVSEINNRKDVIAAFELANVARIKAKREKRFIGYIATEKFLRKLSRNDELIRQCSRALRKEEFFFHLQPQVDMKSGAIVSAEALARLKIDGEFVSPEEFIPVLESNGLVVDLDHMILRQVCEYLCGRRDRGESLFPISVNLSSIHLSIPNSSEKLSEMIREYDLPNELFCFEITEYNVIQSFARAANYNRTQQACGFKTSVDDFGSGYTGLNIIRKIPISEVKLDKSFLDDSGDAHTAFRNRSILSAIYRLTQDLGIKVVCEGVETEEQRKMLVDIGYRFGQGFYFHRPCDPEKLRIS